jgi:ADP-ribose pyrophosphatase YjhB (NUDIX family)
LIRFSQSIKALKISCPSLIMKTTSAGGIIVNKERVVLVQQYKSSWSLPKGHVDKGEEPLAAAKREILEESGLSDLTLVRELGSYERTGRNSKNKKEMKTIIMFLFKTDQEKLKPQDPAISKAIWVKKKDAAGMLTRKEDRDFLLKHMDDIE